MTKAAATTSRVTVHGAFLLLGGLAALGACTAFDPTLPIHVSEPDESGLPPAQVDLPAVPPLDLLDTPPRHPDGSWSVSGLYLQRDALRDQDLRVTGIVRSIYRCDAEAEQVEGDLAELAGSAPIDPDADPNDGGDGEEVVVRPSRWRPGCRLPHMEIVDNLRADYQMLVVGYDADLYEPQMRPGARYVFEGRFARQAAGFMSTENGLLVVRTIEGEGIALPEPDPIEEPVTP
jgi:hypothetical protein